MMNEMDVRKKMLEELMGQMDDRMMGRLKPKGASGMADMMAAEPDADEMGGAGDSDEDDELTKKLRQASMK